MNYICRVLDYMAWFWFMEWLILVYIINRIIHGRLEIWNLSSRVHIRYLTRSLRSLVRHRCEHSKINSISPRDHVLFSIFTTLNCTLYCCIILIVIFRLLYLYFLIVIIVYCFIMRAASLSGYCLVLSSLNKVDIYIHTGTYIHVVKTYWMLDQFCLLEDL